jgi:hypothetical protein
VLLPSRTPWPDSYPTHAYARFSPQEKADEIRKEKERRERGQKIDETLEERQRLQRKRDNEKLKKEKEVRLTGCWYCLLSLGILCA